MNNEKGKGKWEKGKGKWEMGNKSQVPSTKLLISTKIQAPNPKQAPMTEMQNSQASSASWQN